LWVYRRHHQISSSMISDWGSMYLMIFYDFSLLAPSYFDIVLDIYTQIIGIESAWKFAKNHATEPTSFAELESRRVPLCAVSETLAPATENNRWGFKVYAIQDPHVFLFLSCLTFRHCSEVLVLKCAKVAGEIRTRLGNLHDVDYNKGQGPPWQGAGL
jgi:hypothetical protein